MAIIEYTFEKVGFMFGIFSNARKPLFLVFIASLLALIATGAIVKAVIFLCVVIVLIIGGLWQANVYHIQHIKIDDAGINLTVFKYGGKFLEKQFNFNDVTFDLKIASTSIRGTTCKLIINIGGTVISQYPINGWKEVHFHKILGCPGINKVAAK